MIEHTKAKARKSERKTSIYKNGKGTVGRGSVECVYVRRKKQNCPIDDEGLRFIIAIERTKQAPHKKDCTPFQAATDEHQIVNFPRR